MKCYFTWENAMPVGSILRMRKLPLVILSLLAVTSAANLPSKKYLDLASIKTMVAAAEAEAKQRDVSVTICIVDESGNLLFLQKGDTASINTVEFARQKARHSALYGSPSREGSEQMKNGSAGALAFPGFFPAQGGVPIKVDGQILGGIACSGAKSEVDEAISQSAIDALFKK